VARDVVVEVMSAVAPEELVGVVEFDTVVPMGTNRDGRCAGSG
jgi:hypothetical protein